MNYKRRGERIVELEKSLSIAMNMLDKSFQVSIRELGLKTRTKSCLHDVGIMTIEEAKIALKVFKIRNMGYVSKKDLIDCILKYEGLSLSEERMHSNKHRHIERGSDK